MQSKQLCFFPEIPDFTAVVPKCKRSWRKTDLQRYAFILESVRYPTLQQLWERPGRMRNF